MKRGWRCRWWTGGAILAIGLPGWVACSSPEDRPNIVLISIDSLRPDRLGIYGHDRDTSPNIDRFASEAVVFDSAFSTTSWTLPSHVSMLTGLYPEVHGVARGKQRVGDSAVLASEMLREEGYQALAVVAGPYLRSRFGFNQGWDDYDDYTISVRGKRATTGGPFTPRQHRRIVEMLDGRDSRPLFLFLHYWDVHYDYNPPEPWASMFDPDYEGSLDVGLYTSNEGIHPGMDRRDLEHLLALYDGEVAYTDHWIGELFNELRQRQLFDESIIIVTSDHGDEFFEHGHKGHRVNLYNSTLQIPLIVRFPQARWGGERVSVPVSLVDLVPTLLAWLSVDPPTVINGRSLIPLLDPQTGDATRVVFADLVSEQKTMISGNWKLLVGPRGADATELYDLAEDPNERNDRSLDEPERTEDMVDTLQLWLALAQKQGRGRDRETIEYDDETRQVLESLGYID